MALDAILGNERLKENLEQSLRRNHLSHFYLISGPEGSGKRMLARYLSAAILCTERDRPCLQCNACRKVLAGTHPDIILADDPDKKTVGVAVARDAREDMFIMPNESNYKIYQFPRADEMTIPAQNALLKILEEPPAYGVFLLLVCNPNKLLPTIRSRGTELRLQPLTSEVLKPWLRRRFPDVDAARLDAAIVRSGGFAGQAAAMLDADEAADARTARWASALCSRDPLGLLQVLVPMEKAKREDLTGLLEQWLDLTAEAMVCRAGGVTISETARQLAQSLTAAELQETVSHLRKALLYAGSNVSTAAITGFLSWKLIPSADGEDAS